ncbi:phytanoyl-CoA dioxygenase family protein [Solitalea koreensis]|uniref:Ectoine hydroxylase-related dioxygenase, phytanoyl-CoA dioxygenase (PhyH) family n=1 Tax=Solitalea koreensis TaxID=543615 RepID=A0A521DL94_9SPHI|nr:phytanoyl-CoA dioxygenase family protein [Solitalea koreensis]SMO71871.1 Ectoine hydroxylase-related dioxygenase, phytanoyl-CoA dioxygenase (PhyH) family [Solitalea koreensis]
MNKEQAYLRNGSISQENIAFYAEYGYLIAPRLLSNTEIRELKQETAAIFRGERGYVEGMLPVEKNETDADVLKKYVAIHFPHKISPLIHTYLSHQKIVDVLINIISPNVKCMQSMLFVKGPGKAGQAWHQDEYYIPTRDRSLTGVWIAIDDATIDNGCLWIVPGRPGYMMPRVKNDCNEYADVDTIDVSHYADNLVPVEVEKGSVVFFNGYTLHSSRRNKTTDCFRTALVNHYMSAESMLPWDQDGKLQPTEDLRDVVMVAGEDPYAWKGTIDANQPYLRPEVLKIKTDL